MSDATKSGVKQFGRKLSLIAQDVDADGIELADLRCVFQVTSNTKSTPSTLTARIYNLNNDTAGKLVNMTTTPTAQAISRSGGAPGVAQVILQAGYEGNYGILFKGDLVQPKWGRESGTDTYVDLLAADGQFAHLWGIINTTLAAGYTPSDVADELRNVYKAFNVDVDNLPDTIPLHRAPRGKVMYGMAHQYRSDLAKTYDMNGYTHGSVSRWLPFSAYNPGDIIVVNSETGMIGFPEQTAFGVSVRMLLNPSVGPGTLLRIKNDDIQKLPFTVTTNETLQNKRLKENLERNDGAYKVLGVTHFGDTRGNEWYSDAICIGTSTKEGLVNVPADYWWAVNL